MPADFKDKYPSTRVIIDCTEIRCQMPKSLRLNSELFSSYKNHTTPQRLVGIAPGGFLFFFFFSFAEFLKSFFRFKRHGVIAERSQVKENDSNDSDFPLKLMEKTTNGMDIG